MTATADAARALRIEAVTGRLARGLAADVILVEGRPFEDLAALRRVVAVWARGRCVRFEA